MNNGKMLGRKIHLCPHGRYCTCNPAPGKDTTRAKRLAKRQERQEWRKIVSNI